MNKKKQKQETIQPQDPWIKPHYVLVDDALKVQDLAPYQKLIILRKPDGEKKCVVDLALSNKDALELHENSLKAPLKNLQKPYYSRMLYQSQPMINNQTEEDINQIAACLQRVVKEGADLEQKYSSETKVDFLQTNSKPFATTQKDVSEIDMVQIKVPNNQWQTIDNEWQEWYERLNRQNGVMLYDMKNQKEYVVSIQPVFRDFVDELTPLKPRFFSQPKPQPLALKQPTPFLKSPPIATSQTTADKPVFQKPKKGFFSFFKAFLVKIKV